jgi:hypothetical protein
MDRRPGPPAETAAGRWRAVVTGLRRITRGDHNHGMRVHVLRRSPPALALTPEIRWVLLRAFGPPRAAFPDRVDGQRAAGLARDLGVVERIGARVPSSLLVAELGREAACQLAVSRLQVLAGVRELCDLIPELASAAVEAGIPLVFLKFAALHVGGYLAEDSRAAGDVDVLVPERDAERAAQTLATRGFRSAEATLADHHLPPLHDSQRRVVELHTRVPGLKGPDGRRFAGFEALDSAGGLEPAPGFGHCCYLPRRDLLVAHTVAHGLAQHGGADDYPATRTLADVIDLLPGERRTRSLRALEWIADDVSRSDLEAVLGLCDSLEKGDLDGLDAEPKARFEGVLLRHILAASLDPDSRYSLAIGLVLQPLTDEPRFKRFLKRVRCAVLPTDAEIATRLGLPSARLVDRRLRLAHARRLARRLPALARAALRAVWRRVRGGTPRFEGS